MLQNNDGLSLYDGPFSNMQKILLHFLSGDSFLQVKESTCILYLRAPDSVGFHDTSKKFFLILHEGLACQSPSQNRAKPKYFTKGYAATAEGKVIAMAHFCLT